MFKLSLPLSRDSGLIIRDKRGATGSGRGGPSLDALIVVSRLRTAKEAELGERGPITDMERMQQRLLDATRKLSHFEPVGKIRAKERKIQNQKTNDRGTRILLKLEEGVNEDREREKLGRLREEVLRREVNLYKLAGFLGTILKKVESKYFEMLESENLGFVDSLNNELVTLSNKLMGLLGYVDLENQTLNSLKGFLLGFLEKLDDKIEDFEKLDAGQFSEVVKLLGEVNALF